MSRRFDILKGHRAVEFDYHSEGKYVNYSECEKLAARIAHLEALIADAPHGKDCPRSSKHSSFLSCNCFKSRALDTKEKSND